jgi:hypothetical protein
MSDQDSFLNGIEILDSSNATSFTSASLITLGGISISKNTIIGGDTSILSTTISTTTSTGSLIISGGIGIQGSLYGNLSNFKFLQATTSATIPNLISSSGSFGNLLATNFSPINITTSNLFVSGTSSMANALFTNITTSNMTLNNNFSSQTMNILGTINSTSTSTGTIVISGGMGINQSIFANKGYYGNKVNDANNNRPLNLVDTNAAISCWRWVPPTGANSGNPAIELIAGTGGSAITPGNNYWDIYLDDADAMVFRHRTIGVSEPFLYICSSGNVGIGNSSISTTAYKLDVDGIISTRSTTNSTSITTGALIVNGGVGINHDVYIGGNIVINDTSDSINATTGGSILTRGGVSIAKSLDVGSTINATDKSSGALIVSGGAGFNGDIYANNIYSNGILVGGGSSIYGSEYNSVSALGTVGTSAATFTLRTSMTTSSLVGGDYVINIGYTYYQNSSTSSDATFLGLLNPTNLSTGSIVHNCVDRLPRNTLSLPKYSSVNVSLTSGSKIITLIWKSQNSGQISNIANVKLELFRIS